MNIIIRRKGLGMTSCREIAAQTNNQFTVVRNDKLMPKNVNFCVRWGCTSNIPTQNVLNTARAIHEVNDKLGFRRVLEDSGERLAPKTWFTTEAWLKDAEKYPNVILRPSRHAQGRNLLFVNKNNQGDLNKMYSFTRKHPYYYIGEFIDKVSEFRVFIVSGRVVSVAQKTPGNPDDIAWNVAKGGRFDNVRWDAWNLKAIKQAVKAFNLTTLDFGGVDVMIDKDNNSYILEINSAPSLTSPYRQSCMAKAFDYIVDNDKKRIPLVNELGGYAKFIHPAISDKAKLVI